MYSLKHGDYYLKPADRDGSVWTTDPDEAHKLLRDAARKMLDSVVAGTEIVPATADLAQLLAWNDEQVRQWLETTWERKMGVVGTTERVEQRIGNILGALDSDMGLSHPRRERMVQLLHAALEAFTAANDALGKARLKEMNAGADLKTLHRAAEITAEISPKYDYDKVRGARKPGDA